MVDDRFTPVWPQRESFLMTSHDLMSTPVVRTIHHLICVCVRACVSDTFQTPPHSYCGEGKIWPSPATGASQLFAEVQMSCEKYFRRWLHLFTCWLTEGISRVVETVSVVIFRLSSPTFCMRLQMEVAQHCLTNSNFGCNLISESRLCAVKVGASEGCFTNSQICPLLIGYHYRLELISRFYWSLLNNFGVKLTKCWAHSFRWSHSGSLNLKVMVLLPSGLTDQKS